MCILGEPTEGKVVLGHFGSLWLRVSTRATSSTRRSARGSATQNSIVRMHDVLGAVLEWIPAWEENPANAYRGAKAIVNVGSIRAGSAGGSRARRIARLFLDVRVPPTKPMAVARREVLDLVRGLQERFPDYGIEGEVYVTAPGAEIEEGHELVGRSTVAHGGIRLAARARHHALVLRRSVLTRYGIATVNYGTSSGLPDAELGENLDIDGLVQTAEVYARAATECASVRMSLYQLPNGPPGSGRRRRLRPPRGDHGAGGRAGVVARAGRPGELGAERAVLYVYPRTGRPDRCSGRLGRDPRRARVHAAVVRFPRPREELRALGATGSPGCRRRRSRSRSSSRSASACSTRWSPTPSSCSGTSCGCRRSSSRAPTLYRRVTLVLRGGEDREGLLPGVPARQERGGGARWLGS